MTSTSHESRAWQRPDESAAKPASARLVDPEDDLPITTYRGDSGETAATTAIPRFDTASPDDVTEVTSASSSSPSSMAFDLMHEPEPLPYVQPRERGSQQPAEPAEIEPDPETDARVRVAKRRGTQDLGLLVLRVGLGAWLVVHGLQKAFGWWGGQGLNGYEHALAAAGFQHAGILTYLATGAQIGAGVLLVLGLFTPVAAAVALSYLVNALAVEVAAQPVHGYFPYFLPEGHEYLVTMIVLAAALTLTGPGLYGFDAGRGWARRPFIGSFLCLLIGVGVGVGVWMLLNGSNPLR
ncbi:DoxX family protein [Mycolicibacterium llatzerense]|uniref:Membrane protein n=1 Tax=Mycolicibacterium llatzerense TaxID=280871 RepID=A0A0D1LI18_9MYCO|nr:DoxX family protein [Mycolicibacterium llatzerense]KIU15676.1 membrane protein [Mycolicibacterium llatzerense]